ncbi:capsular biosynthesis protein [Shewanella corallii]|uniref:Capsular biosynthesis protein n=1 Tax=Shewanella corallii TaxID=560080 RepID=A0ABT0N6T6_9GAMM|nr:capsular biosynthesis protein [Shewanella corallii]MCL2914169.1 capsular biosynthesis protein [Shewanella corallii]
MNVVLLQGPLGPFFQTLGNHLINEGHQVYKICFNGGDECWPTDAKLVRYTAPIKYWSKYFSEFCSTHKIDAVLVYGDCRSYHALAAKVCTRMDIAFWALEEGYLRPDFVTMEQGGVNANSPHYPVRANLANYKADTPGSYRVIVGKTFGARAWYASRYHINKFLGRVRYTHFVDHRPWGLVKEALSWVKGGLIKLRYKPRDKALLTHLQAHAGSVFLLPLQVSEDFQIRNHSNYRDVASVINEVVTSFARHSDPQDILLIKHHPMDRGFIDYQDQILRLVNALKVQNRVHYGYELPLPKVYPLLKGVVTVNSTVGFSALLHQVPVKCLGRALYHIKGLTSDVPLSRFWHEQAEVDMEVFENVRTAFLHETQLNGCYYKDMELTAQKVCQKMASSIAHQLNLELVS